MARLSTRRLNRATLARQMLLKREAVDAIEGVHRAVALQAQEPASPYVALHTRLEAFDPDQLDAAFEGSDVVKASLMRITLHAVTAKDYPAFHAAMTPALRASRLNDRRFKAMNLTTDDADALLPELLEFLAEPRGNAEVQAKLEERAGPQPDPGLWWALRTYAPVAHAPVGGPWSFDRRPQYRSAPLLEQVDHADGVKNLIRRYLDGFGPATAQDIGQFSILPQSVIGPTLAEMGGELVAHEGPAGRTYFDVADGALPDGRTAAPVRLLPMWDSTLLAYADRSRLLPEPYRKTAIRTNGDVLPTVLVDGFVSGVWRLRDGAIEVTAFDAWSTRTWKSVEEEAARMSALLNNRDPDTYGRYGRWWEGLPATQVRRLG